MEWCEAMRFHGETLTSARVPTQMFVCCVFRNANFVLQPRVKNEHISLLLCWLRKPVQQGSLHILNVIANGYTSFFVQSKWALEHYSVLSEGEKKSLYFRTRTWSGTYRSISWVQYNVACYLLKLPLLLKWCNSTMVSIFFFRNRFEEACVANQPLKMIKPFFRGRSQWSIQHFGAHYWQMNRHWIKCRYANAQSASFQGCLSTLRCLNMLEVAVGKNIHSDIRFSYITALTNGLWGDLDNAVQITLVK